MGFVASRFGFVGNSLASVCSEEVGAKFQINFWNWNVKWCKGRMWCLVSLFLRSCYRCSLKFWGQIPEFFGDWGKELEKQSLRKWREYGGKSLSKAVYKKSHQWRYLVLQISQEKGVEVKKWGVIFWICWIVFGIWRHLWNPGQSQPGGPKMEFGVGGNGARQPVLFSHLPFSCFRSCWSGKFRSLERGGGAAALIWIIPERDSSVVPAQEMGICCSGILVRFVWQRWQPGPFPVSKTTGVTPLRRKLGLLLLNQQHKYNSQIF